MATLDGMEIRALNSNEMKACLFGGVPKWTKGTDCKSSP